MESLFVVTVVFVVCFWFLRVFFSDNSQGLFHMVDEKSKGGLELAVVIAISVVLAFVLLSQNPQKPVTNEPTPPPPEDQITEEFTPAEMLGVPTDHMEVAAEAQALFPNAFTVTEPEKAAQNAKKNVRIYEITRRVSLAGKPIGQDLSCGPQGTGDCVGWGLSRAKTERLAVQVYKGETIAPGIAAPHYEYGIARRHADQQGMRPLPCSAAGAYPSVAALACKEWGWCPIADCPPYKGALANAWGCKGIPKEYLEKGRKNAGGDCYPIRDVDECIEAIVNLYPCTIAVPFTPGQRYKADGRHCLKWNGPNQGGHQMCITAYDGSLGPGKEYFFIQNSHGKVAQAATEPLQGEPAGGFWVPKSQLVSWLKSRSCEIWAVSDVDGFFAEDKIDWSVFDQFDQPVPKMKEVENESASRGVVRHYGMAL